MRFVTFDDDGTDRSAVLRGTEAFVFPGSHSLLGVLRGGQTLTEVGTQALAHSRDVRAFDQLRLRAPIPDPPTVRDFMAFERHVEGVAMLAGGTGDIPNQWYAAPAFYFTNPYAVIGPHDDVAFPPGSEVLDFELEVAAVIGAAGSDLSPRDAESHIAGYTVMNDWSARDLQFEDMQVRLGPAKGKDFATSIGPVLVTPDELEEWRTGTGYSLALPHE